jgi:hypothetical protein
MAEDNEELVRLRVNEFRGSNEVFNNIFEYVSHRLEFDPACSGPEMYDMIRFAFMDELASPDEYPLGFFEASALDQYFFTSFKPTGFWRAAYKFPRGGEIIGTKGRVVHVGMFTFDFESV